MMQVSARNCAQPHPVRPPQASASPAPGALTAGALKAGDLTSGDRAPATMSSGGTSAGGDLIVTACVMAAFSVAAEDLARPSRGPAPVALARQVAMYLHHVELRLTLTEVARRFGRDRTTVAHACRTIEERRDEPGFEAFVAALEETIRAARELVAGVRANVRASVRANVRTSVRAGGRAGSRA